MDQPLAERLTLPVSDADFQALAELLADVVESGAAVSFLAPLSVEHAETWWRKTISTSHPSAVFLVARDTEGIVGTVQLHPAWAPNQPHRAEVAKLLVHRRARRMGMGTRLMQAVEEAARLAGFTLLTLDAKRGEAAERLYRKLGWTHAGTIPRFAVDPDGRTPHDAVILYKELGRPPMIPGDQIVRRGSWLYDGSVPSAVVITRSDVFFGSGDQEDAPEIRDDREAETFRVWFESPPGSGQFPACGGQFHSMDEAIDATSKLLASKPRWE